MYECVALLRSGSVCEDAVSVRWNWRVDKRARLYTEWSRPG